MAELIIQTRITPPRTPSNIIHRERLLNLIKENIEKNLILICSPAGYGKTTLIEDFLNNNNLEFGWLFASSDVNNHYIFFSYLTHALKKVNDKFGEATLQIIESVKQEEKRFPGINNIIEEITGNFINEFYQCFTSDVYLVIDDLHNIKNSEWLKISFNKLVENLPQNLHLIITSRTLPDFNLTRLSAKRNMLQIQPYDLNFTLEEIAKLLDDIYSLKYTEDDLKFLEDKLSGWITGIHLIIQAYGENFSKAKFQSETLPENIFNFFANEIFENLDKETQTFLLDTAMLEVIEPSVCDSLLGVENSSKIIGELLNKNIFIRPVEDSQDISHSTKLYSYQDLFRKFLISKFYELKSKDEKNSLLKKFYRHYLEHGDVSSAISYCLLAGDDRSAIPLIKENFQEFFNKGNFENLWKWVENIRDELFTEIPELFYYRGLLYKYYIGDLEKSLQFIQKAIQSLEKHNEKEFIINCYIAKADVLLNLGRNEEVIKDLSHLAEVDTIPENRAKILYLLAYSHFISSNYDSALELLNKSLEICTENDFKDIQLDIFNELGLIYVYRGEYIKATFYYEKIIEKSSNLFKKFVSLCNLVLVYSRSGKYEKAREYISMAEELLHRFTTPIFENSILLAHFSLRFDTGDYEESIELLEKINKTAKRLNRKDHIYLSYVLLSETYYYFNKLNKAVEYLNLSRDYLDENNKMMLEHAVLDAIIRKKTGTNGDVESALLNAYTHFTENMFIENKVKFGYHLADYYLKSNMSETSLKYLQESIKTGAEKEYISYFETELLHSRTLFDLAIENKIEKGFIKTIIESLTERKSFDWLSEECKQRISKQIDDLYDINMECFGGLEFKVRGRTVPEEKWIRKKRKLVLAYLLLFPMVPLTKDKIIDLFYPDTPLDSADNTFHQTVSNIRSALKIEDSIPETKSSPKKDKSKTAKLKDRPLPAVIPQLILYEDRVLKLNPDFIYRVDALEFNTLYNTANASGTSSTRKAELAKKAVELYKGELLSGYYDQWCEDLRQEFQNKFISLCEGLIETLKSKKNYEEVICYSDKLLKADKLNVNGYINIIESYVMLDSINRARDKFSQMLKTYEAELGEKPPKEVMEKVKKILL